MIIGGACRPVEGIRAIRGSFPRVLQCGRDVYRSHVVGPMHRLSTTHGATSFDRVTPTTLPVFPLRRPRQHSRRNSSHAIPEERKINKRIAGTNIRSTASSTMSASLPSFKPLALPPESALRREHRAAIAVSAPENEATSAVRAEDVARFGRDNVPNFEDPAGSYASFTLWELVRAYAVLKACSIGVLVSHSEALLKLGYAMVGEKLTNRLLGETFFAHFCAGETAQQVGERGSSLRALGVGGILDYAAEVDLESPDQGATAIDSATKESNKDGRLPQEVAECRTYDYVGEAACDARSATFMACIDAVRDQTPGGFAAMKLSALGDPVLLAQLTTCVQLVLKLFEEFDCDHDGAVSRLEFEDSYRKWFLCESSEEREALDRIMEHLDPHGRGCIDYLEWSNGMRLDNLGEITANCRNPGPMAAAALDTNGIVLKEAMWGRIAALAQAAAEAEVRLMIDAEQSWFQPAIDNVVYGLQREFNQDFPAIFTTYQCYLKDSLERLAMDLERADRGGYVWAGKLVRGAYMVSERERARKEGYESPVFETAEETHACFNDAVTTVLEHMARGNRAEVMIATHNQASIEHAIGLMHKLGIPKEGGVSFGQLLGMSDNLTFPLGSHGYKAYKYIPYGKVGETIPYLIRRAQENSGMLGRASHERALLLGEMRRRLLGY